MKVGQIVQKMLNKNVKINGASKYHDQLGHIISAAFLTKWPLKKFDAPVIFDTNNLASEQLAELCQRMLVRCQYEDATQVTFLYPGSITLSKKDELLQSALNGKKGALINMPNQNGKKLSKNEALGWTHLFAI